MFYLFFPKLYGLIGDCLKQIKSEASPCEKKKKKQYIK